MNNRSTLQLCVFLGHIPFVVLEYLCEHEKYLPKEHPYTKKERPLAFNIFNNSLANDDLVI